MTSPEERLKLARLSIEGLSIGDAFGDRFFVADNPQSLIDSRTLPAGAWAYTDDTNMALSVYDIIRRYQEINQDALANSFAQHYDPERGYGPAMHRVLTEIESGQTWQTVAKNQFSGQGSYGNGAAMRVAPIGAYFADDLQKAVEQSQKSAEITHAHHEGIAGAIAVAIAAAFASRLKDLAVPSRSELLELILQYVPDSEVKSRIRRARDIHSSAVEHVTRMIGNGTQMSAQDTVPFALWCVGESLSDFENALWLTASGFGDVDTNCAIVGGIVALYVGHDSIPQTWLTRREKLPSWAFEQ